MANRNPFSGVPQSVITLGLLAFLAIWLAITYLIFKEHAPLIFRIMWPVFEAILVVWVSSLMFGTTTVLIGDGELKVTRRLLGIPRIDAASSFRRGARRPLESRA